jgi:hypothetical protein
MTDMYELLLEARALLKSFNRDFPKSNLIDRIDAALAQRPEPDCWINRGDLEAMKEQQFNSCLVWRAEDEFHKARMPLYAAPPSLGQIKASGHVDAQEQIGRCVRTIEILCDQFGYDPFEFLAVDEERSSQIKALEEEIERLKLALKIAKDPDEEPSAGMVEPLSEIDIACRDIARAMQGRIDNATHRAEAAERLLRDAKREALREAVYFIRNRENIDVNPDWLADEIENMASERDRKE